MSHGTSGLFYAKSLLAKDRAVGPAFCKPINVRVYSAPPPVRMRVVTYEMTYWNGKDQPDVPSQWDKLIRYQAPSGLHSFSFTIGTFAMSLNDLLTEIRRHFYAIVQTGKSCRSAKVGVERLFGMNTSEHTFTTLQPNRSSFRVYDVHHVEFIRIDTNKEHYVASEKLRYHADVNIDNVKSVIGEKYLSAEMSYEDNRRLNTLALNHLQCGETLSIVKNFSKNFMV